MEHSRASLVNCVWASANQTGLSGTEQASEGLFDIIIGQVAEQGQAPVVQGFCFQRAPDLGQL